MVAVISHGSLKKPECAVASMIPWSCGVTQRMPIFEDSVVTINHSIKSECGLKVGSSIPNLIIDNTR